MLRLPMSSVVAVGFLIYAASSSSAAEAEVRSHPPQRLLPQARQYPLTDGPKFFVDPVRGDDAHPGTEAAPWKSVAFGVRKLSPGDTLYLRGGIYYERFALDRSGTEQAPITISGYPNELAHINGGLREFLETPEISWEPAPGGAEGEFVSTQTYESVDRRRVPTHFLPNSWEPFWGKEEERPLALGNFADSMIPLHGYRHHVDLTSASEFQTGGKFDMRDIGMYAGPGLWFNRETGKIHIRLAHHRLEGLGGRAYRGETDPRKLPLIIAAGFGEELLRLTGVKHVVVKDLVFCGGTGNVVVNVYGADHVQLDHLTVHGGSPALMIDASQNVQVTHSAFRGLAAPWISRAHQKYRGTPSYQIVLRNSQPFNENIEFANCEFTDDHDFAFLRFSKNLQFHHNYVDNFNDDGLECGPKLRDHTIYIHENRIGRCYIPLSQHQFTKDDSPVDHALGSGVHFYRNVVDLRGGTYSGPPSAADPTGAYLRQEGHLVSDHGSPVWPVMYAYHNTFLRHTPVYRDYFLFGLGAAGLRQNERDVFNNIFVQTNDLPGVVYIGAPPVPVLREGGNLLWSLKGASASPDKHFGKLRASPLFADSQKHYLPGWTTHDLVDDPQFASLPDDEMQPADLRLFAGSAAINAGQTIPAEWPDPWRAKDADAPDIGALPLGIDPVGVGVDGRISISGGKQP